MEIRPLLPDSVRRISLLRTLRTINFAGIQPTYRELVMVNDGRDDIPRQTIEKRRASITNMIRRGLIVGTALPGGTEFRLQITDAGRANLITLGLYEPTTEK